MITDVMFQNEAAQALKDAQVNEAAQALEDAQTKEEKILDRINLVSRATDKAYVTEETKSSSLEILNKELEVAQQKVDVALREWLTKIVSK